MDTSYYIYILRCSDNTLYIGSAQNVEERIVAHNKGRGAAYTFKRRPVKLLYTEKHDSLQAAMARERQLKGWNRAKKEALIAGDLDRLGALARPNGAASISSSYSP